MDSDCRHPVIEPSRLVFKAPFCEPVEAIMQITNTSTKNSLCFKVKTTAPRQYSVKPVFGVIKPKQSVFIVVKLKPFESEDVDFASLRHRFLVQCLYVFDENPDLETIWQSARPSAIMESKLIVIFDLREADRTILQSVPTSSEVDDAYQLDPIIESSGGNHVYDCNYAEASFSSLGSTYPSSSAQSGEVARLSALESFSSNAFDSGIPMLQVVLIALASLLVGLILGKLF